MPYKNHVISTNNERLTSGFRTSSRPDHDGMDFTDADRLELRQDVYIIAFADGKVVLYGFGASVGYYVDVLHEGNVLTRYFHMKRMFSGTAGQTVKKGDILGIMGTTGNSTGVHLHFAVKEGSTYYSNGVYVNPEPYLMGGKSIRCSEPVKPIDPINQTVTLGEGNIVAIQTGAVYGGLSTARGKTVPESQLGGKRHTVSAITNRYGEREALLKEINSWVAVKYLVCVV